MTKFIGYHHNNDKFEKQKIFNFENDYVKEVILGWKTPITDKEQILGICDKKNYLFIKWNWFQTILDSIGRE